MRNLVGKLLVDAIERELRKACSRRFVELPGIKHLGACEAREGASEQSGEAT